MPKIIWSQTASKDMARLEKGVAARIIEKIETASKNTDHYFRRLAGFEEAKLRVGEYRVLARLLCGGEIIIIERVGHRKKIYKNID